MAILGIDIGGTKTALLLGNSDGETSGRVEFSTQPERGFDAWLKDVVEHAASLQLQVAVDCVSVAVGGPLDARSGSLLSPPHLQGWPHELPLAERLSSRLGNLPVHLLHDAQAGAYAEYEFGLGAVDPSVRRIAFLTFATGFGMGVVLDGRLLEIPGEIGHWRVAEDGPEMFGKRGCLEGLASGAGIAAQATATGEFSPTTDVESLAEAARAGNRTARDLFEGVAVQVGRQCARLIDLFGLDAVVLGTIGIHAGDLLMRQIQQVTKEETLPHLWAKCRVLPAALGSRLGDVACLSAAIRAGYRSSKGGKALGPSSGSQLQRLADLTIQVGADRSLMSGIDKAAERICHALESGHRVLTCGNGGSATDASHLAEELVGRYRGNRRPLPGISLTADASALTCIANDFGFEEIFARQVEAFGAPGDVLVAFTTSGNSENINRALRRARERGMITVCLTGKTGGEALQLAEIPILIPDSDSARIQELHTFVLHAICEAVEAFFPAM